MSHNLLSGIHPWSLTHSKQWRWSWTSGETPLHSLHSPSWTALWLQWSHSDSWTPPSPRTWSGTLTSTHIDIVKKAQQRLYFLHQLREFNLPQELLKQFYSAVIESVLFTSVTLWFGSATKSDVRRLQRMVRPAERIIGAPLPTLQELYTSRLRKRAQKITLVPSHLNFCHLVGATEHRTQGQPDTRTVSFTRQSTSC